MEVHYFEYFYWLSKSNTDTDLELGTVSVAEPEIRKISQVNF